ncbi:MAG: hypothetical protein ACRC28_07790 [Clostridium sp.]|uniref:hypothetical protein n=1 Tax=Clostridium sp. TaxID=1506 RepID=UPI003F33A172
MEEKISLKQWTFLVFSCIVLLTIYYIIDKNFDGLVNSILENLIGTIVTMLFTGVFLDYILRRREKRRAENRMNTLLGVFYGDFGNELLYEFIAADLCVVCLVRKAKINNDWTEKNYEVLRETFEQYEYSVEGERIDIKKIAKIIKDSESFILDILFTQVIQNGGELSEILFDVIHLRDEINDLEDINNIKEDELSHLELDINRLYKRLAINWIIYMKFLRGNYPQLFVKALKKSPYEKYKVR